MTLKLCRLCDYPLRPPARDDYHEHCWRKIQEAKTKAEREAE